MLWGFYQLPMEPKSQNYTAFSTPSGSFMWLRMPMGLKGSPNTFQSLVEHTLLGLTWNITVFIQMTASSFQKLQKSTSKDCNKFYKDFARRT